MRVSQVLPAVAIAAMAHAQIVSSIEGTVIDPSGALVQAASVRVLSTLTGAERRLATDSRGRYYVAGLDPGVYSVEVASPGFRIEVVESLRLDAGRTVRADVALKIGSTQERVVVTGEAPLVNLAPTDWGGSTDRREIESLPMNGRDLFDLASQEPGVMAPRNNVPDLIKGAGLRLSVNGGRLNQNSFRLDGVYINDATGTAPASSGGLLLGVEGIQELRVVSSPFSAEYGRAAAGAVVAVSRSGSNRVHGSVYELLRNSATDGRNFFDPPAQEKPPLRKNQFGGLLSGPLRRDSLFLLGNYEGVRQNASIASRAVTLGAEPRQGRIPIPAGGFQTVPVATAVRPYLEAYPLPNGTDFRDGTGEFVAALPLNTLEDYAAGKVNWNASERWRSAARYTFDRARRTVPDHFLIYEQFERSRYHMLHADQQFLQSPATIHNFRFGLSRIFNDESYRVTKTSLAPLEYIPGRGFGSMNVTGLSDVGSSQIRQRPRTFFYRDYQANHDLTHLRGGRTWKLGGTFDIVRFNERSDRMFPGHARFFSVADLLQGRPRTADFMTPGSDTRRRWSQRIYSGYLQHESRWRRLSLGAGVRYEAYSTPTEGDGKIATLRDPLSDTDTTVGGPLFENPSRDNFAPRLSLAWDPLGDGKTVVRAGAGVFFDLLGSKELLIAGVRMPPFYRLGQIANPPFPNFFATATAGVVQTAVDSLGFRLNQPYNLQYQFAIQRQIGASWLAQLSFNSTRGVHIVAFERNINLAIPQTLPGGRLFFAANAPRFNPAFASIGIRTSRFSSWYTSMNASLERRWTSGLRFQAKYTWSKLLDNNTTLVFNDFAGTQPLPTVFNHRQNWGRSDADSRHLLSGNFSWQVPGVAAGRAKWLLGGWELHGLTTAQSGFAFSPTVGFDRARLQAGNDLGQRPDLIAAPGARIVLGDPARWFDPLAFGLPQEGFYGNLGRNVLDGPGLFNADASVHKVVFANDRHRVHLRVEAFNLANRPNFQVPENVQLFDSSQRRLGAAGRIDRTATPARQMQFALKWTF
jgi:hypothetical protein